ncbi:anthranilate synthase component I [Calothrix rhizosoleniae]|uniref:anthranilate synthase component I n=1 Tax=Calothrix rhizosoleniae TaxID=888997 RepID=UPI000B49FD08|nr:anthranilate synthase component I [Calothrix rhizosoleniae]
MVFDLAANNTIPAWYWRSRPLEECTGSAVFASLFLPTSDLGIATLLESPSSTPTDYPQLARYSICAGSPRIVDGKPQMWTPPLGEVLPFLENLLKRQPGKVVSQENSEQIPSLPFTGGWLGWLGYDIAWEIEKLPYTNADSLPFPVAFWYEPECFAVLDHQEQILWLAASSPEQLNGLEKRWIEGRSDGGMEGRSDGIIISSSSAPHTPHTSHTSHTPHFVTSQEDYEAAVNCAKKYIQSGDIFQTNLSLRFAATTQASGWEIYQTLHTINPSPFASYWHTPWGQVISCSPERLVQLQQGQAQSRPIAGTRKRGKNSQQDAQLANELLSNTKELAEHIMLVDLERNDLGRVCEWGTVTVDELLTIERYSHVMHLVSNVTGKLKTSVNGVDLIRAIFPGGTITGCPKVRCMEIIEELEPTRRNLFYGSCGYLDWQGNLDLNILIRTLLLVPASAIATKVDTKRCEDIQKPSKSTIETSSPLTPSTNQSCYDAEVPDKGVDAPIKPAGYLPHSSTFQTNPQQCLPSLLWEQLSQELPKLNLIWGQVGAGIVADSVPEKEWYESLHKARAQLKALAMVLNQYAETNS